MFDCSACVIQVTGCKNSPTKGHPLRSQQEAHNACDVACQCVHPHTPPCSLCVLLLLSDRQGPTSVTYYLSWLLPWKNCQHLIMSILAVVQMKKVDGGFDFYIMCLHRFCCLLCVAVS